MPVKIVKAKKTAKHKKIVLGLLDEFRTAVYRVSKPEDGFVSTSARDNGEKLYDEVLSSDKSVVFVAIDDEKGMGIITAHKVPELRKGLYFVEVEEVFVRPKYQGKGVAQLLMAAVETWAKKEEIESIRLDSGNELKRAHAFYRKSGFEHYAKAFKKKVK